MLDRKATRRTAEFCALRQDCARHVENEKAPRAWTMTVEVRDFSDQGNGAECAKYIPMD